MIFRFSLPEEENTRKHAKDMPTVCTILNLKKWKIAHTKWYSEIYNAKSEQAVIGANRCHINKASMIHDSWQPEGLS